MSFLKYEQLCQLQQLNGLFLGNNYISNNACKRFIAHIASDIKNDLREAVGVARFVSVLSDGSTDKGLFCLFFYFYVACSHSKTKTFCGIPLR